MMSKELAARSVKKAIAILDAAECKYTITTKDGDVYGSVNRRKFKYEYGALRGHVSRHVENIKPGEVRIIPVDDFDYTSLQSSLSSLMLEKYAHESYVSAQINDKKAIEMVFLGSTKDDENEQSNP